MTWKRSKNNLDSRSWSNFSSSVRSRSKGNCRPAKMTVKDLTTILKVMMTIRRRRQLKRRRSSLIRWKKGSKASNVKWQARMTNKTTKRLFKLPKDSLYSSRWHLPGRTKDLRPSQTWHSNTRVPLRSSCSPCHLSARSRVFHLLLT